RSILEHYGLRPSAGGAAGAGERVLAALSDQRRLADFVRPRIADMREALDRETWIASLLAAMEATGFALMPHYFEELAAAVSGRIHEINGEANALLGRAINLASHAQVSEALFKTLGLEVPELRDHNKTHTSTRDEVLQRMRDAHPMPNLVLRHRHLSKLLSTWLAPLAAQALPDALLDGGVAVYPRWMNATATGRLSSNSPNVQATPKLVSDADIAGRTIEINVRAAFVAREGHTLVAVDYSQMEIRVLAHLSEDAQLVSLLRRAGGHGDVFQLMVEWMGSSGGRRCERDHMKRTCYGIIYGQSSRGLSETLDIPEQDAKELIERFLAFFPGVKRFVGEVKARALSEGCVRMLSGRRRPLPGIKSGVEHERARAERQAVNTVIQGSAADIIKMAMVELSRPRRDGTMRHARLLAQLHDELIFEAEASEVDAVARLVVEVMTTVVELSVPLRVSQARGPTWGDLE
ncbi:MAG: DNA polymerase A family protein, partial [Planctomycetota bacterium]|nr:DNA polymerase A family protein [Planctomycetota bacterium]